MNKQKLFPDGQTLIAESPTAGGWEAPQLVPDLSHPGWIKAKTVAEMMGLESERSLANMRCNRAYEGLKPTIPPHHYFGRRIYYWKPQVEAFVARRLGLA